MSNPENMATKEETLQFFYECLLNMSFENSSLGSGQTGYIFKTVQANNKPDNRHAKFLRKLMDCESGVAIPGQPDNHNYVRHLLKHTKVTGSKEDGNPCSGGADHDMCVDIYAKIEPFQTENGRVMFNKITDMLQTAFLNADVEIGSDATGGRKHRVDDEDTEEDVWY